MKPHKVKEIINKLRSHIKYELHYNSNKLLSKSKNNSISVVVSSAHKVGSTWLVKILRDLYIFKYSIVPPEFRSSAENSKLLSLQKEDTFKYLAQLKENYLFKSHSQPPSWNPNNKIKLVTVFRDPRDMAVSNIFYLANLDKKLGGWTEMKDLSHKERLYLYLDKATYDLELLENWYSHNDTIKTKYELLLSDTFNEISKIINELGFDLKDHQIINAINNNSFQKLSGGRKQGQEDNRSFFRKGASGDWKSYFDKDVIDHFKNSQNARWNKLLVNLGYEKSENWSL